MWDITGLIVTAYLTITDKTVQTVAVVVAECAAVIWLASF